MFDGQSLNMVPGGATSYPSVVMAGRTVPWTSVALTATSFTTLATTVATRRDPQARNAQSTVLILCGGTSDLLEGDSGATVLADMQSYAASARAAGFDRVIACTITGDTAFTGGQESARLAANTAIRASASFDAVADLAADPSLDDPTDATYYADGLHWTAAGAAAAAAVVSPLLTSVLAGL